jgi:hemerythrin-like domain-containing protein
MGMTAARMPVAAENSGMSPPAPILLPGAPMPAAGFDEPFELLAGCHDRVRRSLTLLTRLVEHLLQHGVDADARSAATDVLRYFDIAAPQHHLDEELHVLPVLEAAGDGALLAAVRRLRNDHEAMARQWQALRVSLAKLRDGGNNWSAMAQHELASQVRGFVDLHAEHLPLEERLVFPAARRMLEAGGAAALQAMGHEMSQRRQA